MTDVGLYVHVPFCPTLCGYCDFYSVIARPDDFDPLVSALLAELHSVMDSPGLRVETIFVGGGTPTHLPAAQLERLMAALGKIARAHGVAEFTVEANPGSLPTDKAAILRQCGVNRVSMGAQSFHQSELHTLERIHQPRDVIAGAEIVRQAGFEHFNLDLIFGIPGQTEQSWLHSIEQALDLGVDHLACYGLTYEEGTPLHAAMTAGKVQRMDEDFEARLYRATINWLAAVGFEQYEISNFARPGARSLHNLRYWHNRETLGIGPAAASYLSGTRWRNLPDLAQYIQRIRQGESPRVDTETLDPAERAGETAMLGLRLIEGISCEAFRLATGFDPLVLFAEPLARHAAAGLLITDNAGIALTRSGLLLADHIMADFLKPRCEAASGRGTDL